MDSSIILNEISTYGFEFKVISGRKRLCYLIKCEQCFAFHYKEEHELTRGIRRNKKFFCSKLCRNNYHSTSLEMKCSNCNKDFLIVPSQAQKSKSGNVFCSKSCAASYNNRHKKYGTRRSKLEQYIEGQIRSTFPKLKMYCNSVSVIGSELDFYFPEIKTAIQINGIFHFKPIFGQDRLNKIQKLDQEKRIKCAELEIKLIEIDCSNDNYLNKKLKENRWLQIKNILEEIRVLETQLN